MRGTKLYAILAAMFMAGAFLASPELRVYAANTVLSTDIKDGEVKTPDIAANAVTAAKIKDGEVKAAEIATDAVGAAELQGVTKLLFARCNSDSAAGRGGSPGTNLPVICKITGVDADDNVIATLEAGNYLTNLCFVVQKAVPSSGAVEVRLINVCSGVYTFTTGSTISIIVYDK